MTRRPLDGWVTPGSSTARGRPLRAGLDLGGGSGRTAADPADAGGDLRARLLLDDRAGVLSLLAPGRRGGGAPLLAARERPEERERALDELIAPRWRALLALARKQGLAPAEDAVQTV